MTTPRPPVKSLHGRDDPSCCPSMRIPLLPGRKTAPASHATRSAPWEPCPRRVILPRRTNVTTNLYVGNLAHGITEKDLTNLFSPHGTVQSAQVFLDRQ